MSLDVSNVSSRQRMDLEPGLKRFAHLPSALVVVVVVFLVQSELGNALLMQRRRMTVSADAHRKSSTPPPMPQKRYVSTLNATPIKEPEPRAMPEGFEARRSSRLLYRIHLSTCSYQSVEMRQTSEHLKEAARHQDSFRTCPPLVVNINRQI